MSFNPELWFDENKQALPDELVQKIELKRMHMRGWVLFNNIYHTLDNSMIAHAISKVDDPHKIPFLDNTLRECAHFYILILCIAIEATLRNNEKDYATDYIDKNMGKKNEIFDAMFQLPHWQAAKELMEETVQILQKPFLDKKPGLLELESKWWPFYKHTFQFHGMRWQVDAYEIVLQLRKGKKPEELIHLTHRKEFNAVKNMVDTLKNIDDKRI